MKLEGLSSISGTRGTRLKRNRFTRYDMDILYANQRLIDTGVFRDQYSLSTLSINVQCVPRVSFTVPCARERM